MTLSTHLANNGSLIGHYLWRRANSTAPLARIANATLRQTTTLRPEHTDGYPWVTVARAFDYMARMHFAPLPVRQLPAVRGARLLFERHGERFSGALLRRFFASTEEAVQRFIPGDLASEREFARYAYVLGLFTEVAQNRRYLQGPLFTSYTHESVAALLNIPNTEQIEDLASLGTLAASHLRLQADQEYQPYPALAGMRDLGSLERPLLVGRQLMLINTTTQPAIDARWLRQLLGEALLDYQDKMGIETLGCYMSRQGVMLSWPIARFVTSITGDDATDVRALRREFQYICGLMRPPMSPDNSAAQAS